MKNNALERLFNYDNTSKPDYSIDEQLASGDELDEFSLDGMSDTSRMALFNRVGKHIEEPEFIKEDPGFVNEEPKFIEEDPKPVIKEKLPEKVIVESAEEVEVELPVIEKPKVKPVKKVSKEVKKMDKKKEVTNSSIDVLLDKLCQTLLEELKQSDVTIFNFDKEQMEVLYDHIINKL